MDNHVNRNLRESRLATGRRQDQLHGGRNGVCAARELTRPFCPPFFVRYVRSRRAEQLTASDGSRGTERLRLTPVSLPGQGIPRLHPDPTPEGMHFLYHSPGQVPEFARKL